MKKNILLIIMIIISISFQKIIAAPNCTEEDMLLRCVYEGSNNPNLTGTINFSLISNLHNSSQVNLNVISLVDKNNMLCVNPKNIYTANDFVQNSNYKCPDTINYIRISEAFAGGSSLCTSYFAPSVESINYSKTFLSILNTGIFEFSLKENETCIALKTCKIGNGSFKVDFEKKSITPEGSQHIISEDIKTKNAVMNVFYRVGNGLLKADCSAFSGLFCIKKIYPSNYNPTSGSFETYNYYAPGQGNGKNVLCEETSNTNGSSTLLEETEYGVDAGEGDEFLNNWTEKQLDKNNFAKSKTCSEVFGETTLKFLKSIFRIIKIIAPILTIVLSMSDFIKATAESNADVMKKATKKLLTRGIIVFILYLLPALVNLIMITILGLDGSCF